MTVTGVRPFAPVAVPAATLPGRIVSRVVDSIMFIPIRLLVVALVALTGVPSWVAGWVAGVGLAFSVTVPTAIWGRSPGKRFMGLRVERVGGEPPGWTAAVVREIALYGSVAAARLVGWAVDRYAVEVGDGVTWAMVAVLIAVPLFRSDRRMVHDLIAGTRVLEPRPPAAQETPAVQDT